MFELSFDHLPSAEIQKVGYSKPLGRILGATTYQFILVVYLSCVVRALTCLRDQSGPRAWIPSLKKKIKYQLFNFLLLKFGFFLINLFLLKINDHTEFKCCFQKKIQRYFEKVAITFFISNYQNSYNCVFYILHAYLLFLIKISIEDIFFT